jgi:hypothetical protein
MVAKIRVALMFMALALPACADLSGGKGSTNGPTPDEMRAALKVLLKEHPDMAIPEFQNALDHDPAVVNKGIVYIGAWNCDPKLHSFEALFSSPNISLYEVSGRFEMDNRGIWVALPRRVMLTEKHDIGEFWRAHEVDPFR